VERRISHVIIRQEATIDCYWVDGAYSESSFMATGRHEFDGSMERGGKRYLRFRLARSPKTLNLVEERYFRSLARSRKIIFYK
jgi:hypothetical protein